MKICNGCGELKPLTDYYPKARAKDGRETKCKLCRKATKYERKGPRSINTALLSNAIYSKYKSLHEAGDALGIDGTKLGRYVRGERVPKDRTIDLLEVRLDIPFGSLQADTSLNRDNETDQIGTNDVCENSYSTLNYPSLFTNHSERTLTRRELYQQLLLQG
jgi:hypothetical protein